MNKNDIDTFDCVLRALRERGSCAGLVRPWEYHAWKAQLEVALGCPVVSKSTMAEFSRGAFKFHWARENKVEKRSASMALGSLVDCLVLTPDYFDELYLCEEKQVAVKKDGTPYANGQQDAEQKRRWEAAAAEGVTVISPEDKARGEAIAEQARRHLAQYGMADESSYASQYAVWVYMTEVDGVELACPVVVTGMFDILPDARDDIWDLKSTSEDVSNVERLCYTMEDYKYGLQAAIYLDLYNVVAAEDTRDKFSFLFVGTSEPYMSRVVGMGSAVIDMYREEYRRLLREYCVAWKMGDWGSPEHSMVWFMPSRKEWKRLQEGEFVK